MLNPKQLEELAHKLYATLPSSLQNFEKEIQAQFREILTSTFEQFNLVTRDEFDLQVKVLERTREKVEHLQQQIQALQQTN